MRFEGSWMHQERGKGRCRRRLLRFCPEHLQGGRRHFPRWEDGTQAQGKSGSLVLDVTPSRGWPGGAVTQAVRASLKFS